MKTIKLTLYGGKTVSVPWTEEIETLINSTKQGWYSTSVVDKQTGSMYLLFREKNGALIAFELAIKKRIVAPVTIGQLVAFPGDKKVRYIVKHVDENSVDLLPLASEGVTITTAKGDSASFIRPKKTIRVSTETELLVLKEPGEYDEAKLLKKRKEKVEKVKAEKPPKLKKQVARDTKPNASTKKTTRKIKRKKR